MARMRRRAVVAALVPMVIVAALVGVALSLKRTRRSVWGPEANEFALVTIFDGLEVASRAPALSDGAWLAFFGGGKLDLSRAQIDPHGATLRLRGVMGGGEVTVPRGCRVELRSHAFMGGVRNDVAGPLRADLPTLTLDVFAVMAGFQILRADETGSA